MLLDFANDHTTPLIVAATTKTSSSGGSTTIFLFLILFIAFYFFYLRPRRAKILAAQRANPQSAGPAEIVAGDTVLTASGIIGRVLTIDGDRASVEIAPDTVIEFSRNSLGRRLDPAAPDEDDRWASLIEEPSPPDAAPHDNAPGSSTAAEKDAGEKDPGHGEPGHVHGGPDEEEPGGEQ
jgi:preprotein translocase subunit YajC